MTDEEITNALGNAQADEAGISAAMELLETQAQLRDIEKMEFSAWVIEMERIGSPESLLAVENAHRAQKGMAPLTEPPVAAPPVPPIEDVVSHLNNLYAAQSAPIAQPPVAEEPIEQFAYIEETAEVTSVPVDSDSFVSDESDLDDFDRLLAADTVVGAEDELTALEEELTDEVISSPVSAYETLSVVEADPGVNFVQESAIEEVKLESVAKVSRRSRASSQFWAWLGLSGSVIPVGLAWFISKTGVSFSQAVLAVFLGSLASALVVSVGALAGKRSGLPTLLLSRAAFGVYGNAAPASILTVIRILWTAAIVAVVISFAKDLFQVESFENLTSAPVIQTGLVALFVVAAAITIAIFGGRVLFRAQQASGIFGVLSVALLVAMTANTFSLQDLLLQPTTSWLNAFAVSVLTFAVFGLVWTSAGADFARKLSTSARGASVVGWGTLALAVIPTVVVSYGLALIASASQSTKSDQLLGDFESLLTPWLGYVLLGSAVVSTIVILAMSLYSSNLSLHSIGAKLKPGVAQPIIGTLVLAAGAAATYYLADLWSVLAGYAIVVAIPVAAWSGIFISDILIRRIAYHEISLSRGYGFYKSVNVVNLVGWVIATAAGFGLVTVDQLGFEWTGFIAERLSGAAFWQTTSFGVVIVFAFASLLPVIFGIPRIKRQEAEVLAIEARRDDLKDIFGLVD